MSSAKAAFDQEPQTKDTRGGSRSVVADYAPGADRPLAGYAALMGLYGAAVTAGAVALRRRGQPLSDVRPVDILLVGIATHKLSRRVTKDSVTSFLRAPFTRYEGVSGPAELKERVQGSGLRKAVGELMTCPFCISQWISTGFTFGLLTAPRATRWTASVFASLAIADFLQFAYAWAEQQAQA